jgi:glutamate-1-semialdehyde 2,1-aminomutase
MAGIGGKLRDGLERQAAAHRLEIRVSGPPAIPFLTFRADHGSFARSRTFAAACALRGVYLHPYHNWFLSAAIGEAELARVLEVTDEAFGEVTKGVP